jgi:hypothetical protein
MDEFITRTGRAEQFRRFDAVGLGELLKVNIVQQTRHAPEIRLVSIAKFTGEPSHYSFHCQGVPEVKPVFVVRG